MSPQQLQPSRGVDTGGVDTGGVDTSIVVCTCSRVDLLRQAIDSLLAQTWARNHVVELVVVDDGSTDGTAAYLANLAATARSIPTRIVSGSCRGIAAARNAGISAAQGQWLASFDDDQIADKHWLRALRERAQTSQVQAIGGALSLLLPPGAQAAAALGPRTRAVLGEHLPFATAQPYTGSFHPATNNALFHRDLLTQTGGFNTRFTEGGEDKELFHRLQAAGHVLWFEPAAQAGHITQKHRLERANLRWTSLRLGATDARYFLLQGRVHALRIALLRALASMLRDLPRLPFVTEPRRTDTLCRLWYTEGLLRALRPLWSSHAQESPFLRSMNFRRRNGERLEV